MLQLELDTVLKYSPVRGKKQWREGTSTQVLWLPSLTAKQECVKSPNEGRTEACTQIVLLKGVDRKFNC